MPANCFTKLTSETAAVNYWIIQSLKIIVSSFIYGAGVLLGKGTSQNIWNCLSRVLLFFHKEVRNNGGNRRPPSFKDARTR